MKEKSKQIGDALDHFREFFILEPQFHVENFQVQNLEFFFILFIYIYIWNNINAMLY
jgi:hypothetical protein